MNDIFIIAGLVVCALTGIASYGLGYNNAEDRYQKLASAKGFAIYQEGKYSTEFVWLKKEEVK